MAFEPLVTDVGGAWEVPRRYNGFTVVRERKSRFESGSGTRVKLRR